MKIEMPPAKVEKELCYSDLQSGHVYVPTRRRKVSEIFLKIYEGHVYLESGSFFSAENTALVGELFVELNTKLVIED